MREDEVGRRDVYSVYVGMYLTTRNVRMDGVLCYDILGGCIRVYYGGNLWSCGGKCGGQWI